MILYKLIYGQNVTMNVLLKHKNEKLCSRNIKMRQICIMENVHWLVILHFFSKYGHV